MGQYDVQNSTANVTDIKITPTRSIFTLQTGPMNVTVTFLTPIEVTKSISFKSYEPDTVSVAIGLGQSVYTVLLHVRGSGIP